MRQSEYQQLIIQAFGPAKAPWISHSHVLPGLGGTPDDLIERGVNPAEVWEELCVEFEVPEELRWVVDEDDD